MEDTKQPTLSAIVSAVYAGPCVVGFIHFVIFSMLQYTMTNPTRCLAQYVKSNTLSAHTKRLFCPTTDSLPTDLICDHADYQSCLWFMNTVCDHTT